MKNWTILAALLLSSNFLMAQFQLGVKTSYDVTSGTIDGVAEFLPSPDYMDNYSVGLYGNLPLGQGFSFQPELLFRQKGFSVRESFPVDVFAIDIPIGVEARTIFKYVEMPLLAKYSTGDRVKFFIEAGPALGYAVDAKLKERAHLIVDFNIGEQDLNLSNDLYNRFELSGLIGGGISIPAGNANIDLGMRYQHSITDILDDPIIDVRLRNYGFTFGAGVRFNI